MAGLLFGTTKLLPSRLSTPKSPMNDSPTSSPALGSYRMYIDGEWSNSESSETIEVENPANEETIATIPAGTVNDAQRALEAAKRAQPKWAALPPNERAKLLHKLAGAILAQRDHVGHVWFGCLLAIGDPAGSFEC
ncbi:MAG: aldehyde dehydrogenase family protein [Verrucomicrobia bacterium]|nr:aldehyde dehydrogenase family protein [Verrucomicrobiota bacterium]